MGTFSGALPHAPESFGAQAITPRLVLGPPGFGFTRSIATAVPPAPALRQQHLCYGAERAALTLGSPGLSISSGPCDQANGRRGHWTDTPSLDEGDPPAVLKVLRNAIDDLRIETPGG